MIGKILLFTKEFMCRRHCNETFLTEHERDEHEKKCRSGQRLRIQGDSKVVVAKGPNRAARRSSCKSRTRSSRSAES